MALKLKENEKHRKYLEQQLDKEQQKYSTLLKQYKELRSSIEADGIQKEIRNLEGSVDDVKATFDKIKLMRTEVVCKYIMHV